MSVPLGDLLPMAVGIAISPVPIIAVILMLFTPKARVNGTAFAVGWILGLVGVGVVVLALSGSIDLGTEGEPSTLALILQLVLGVLLLFLAYRNWTSRPAPGQKAETPKWMSTIDSFTAIKALGMAALLSGVNPKNLLLNLAALSVMIEAQLSGSTLLITFVIYVLIASITVLIPVGYYLIGGENAQATLDGWKEWLGHNNATVMAVLLLVLGLKLAGDGLAGLLAT